MHECSSGCLCFGQKLLLHLQLKVLVMLIFLLQVAHLDLFGCLIFLVMLVINVLATNLGLVCLPPDPLDALELDLKGSNGELVFLLTNPSEVSVTEVKAKLSLDSDRGIVLEVVSGLMVHPSILGFFSHFCFSSALVLGEAESLPEDDRFNLVLDLREQLDCCLCNLPCLG